jgi:hypothetical protein
MRPVLSSHQTRSTLGHNSLSLSEGDRKSSAFVLEGFERYECGPESEEDYRYRMLVNLLATVVLIVLIVTGSWNPGNAREHHAARPRLLPTWSEELSSELHALIHAGGRVSRTI